MFFPHVVPSFDLPVSLHYSPLLIHPHSNTSLPQNLPTIAGGDGRYSQSHSQLSDVVVQSVWLLAFVRRDKLALFTVFAFLRYGRGGAGGRADKRKNSSSHPTAYTTQHRALELLLSPDSIHDAAQGIGTPPLTRQHTAATGTPSLTRQHTPSSFCHPTVGTPPLTRQHTRPSSFCPPSGNHHSHSAVVIATEVIATWS